MEMWVLLFFSALVGYVLLKLFQLYRADADLTVLASTLKPDYFKGRVVWITGASSGIGEELCYQLSQLGSKVILSARNKVKLEEVKSKLAHPEDARVLPVDLSDPEATRAAVAEAKKLFGKVDILVNNAGVSTRALFVDIQEHVHRKVMELDFFAPWILSHGLIQGMIDGGFGHFVNISSIWGKGAPSNRSSYSSAKFAIIGLMDSIRHEMQGSHVFVTNVVPGPIVTNAGVNALQADGTTFDKDEKFLSTGMSVQRCVQLILTGVSNQQNEIWVSQQPWLMIPYYSHYCPSLLHRVLGKRARAELQAAKKSS